MIVPKKETLKQRLVSWNFLGKPLHPDLLDAILKDVREWLEDEKNPIIKSQKECPNFNDGSIIGFITGLEGRIE